jgi:hypothetical protein
LDLTEGEMSQPKEPLCRTEENASANPVETVADILERQMTGIIVDWLSRASREPDLATITLNYEERTGHLPQLLAELVTRLRLIGETDALTTQFAAEHGELRRAQGYTIPMMVVESRLLQVSIFSILYKNVKSLDFAVLLPDVMTIADEVDSQLKQQVTRFIEVNKSAAAQKH